MRKEEITCYKQFLVFHNVFHSYVSLVHQDGILCGNGLIGNLSDSWLGGCQLESGMQQTVFFFHLSLLMHVRKAVSAFRKKCLSVLVCKRHGTHRCVTVHNDMTKAGRMALYSNTNKFVCRNVCTGIKWLSSP